MTTGTRASKLREIVKEMEKVTVVADRIVALATRQKSKSPSKSKGPAPLRLEKPIAKKLRKARSNHWQTDGKRSRPSCSKNQ